MMDWIIGAADWIGSVLGHPVALLLGVSLLGQRACRLARYEERCEALFGTPIGTVLEAQSREENIKRLRKLLANLEEG